MKTTTAPEHVAIVDSPPRNCTGALEQRFLTGADYQAMAHDLPLIKRAISHHALTLHGAVLMQGTGNRFQELANVAELGTQAAVVVREFCQAMEAMGTRKPRNHLKGTIKAVKIGSGSETEGELKHQRQHLHRYFVNSLFQHTVIWLFFPLNLGRNSTHQPAELFSLVAPG